METLKIKKGVWKKGGFNANTFNNVSKNLSKPKIEMGLKNIDVTVESVTVDNVIVDNTYDENDKRKNNYCNNDDDDDNINDDSDNNNDHNNESINAQHHLSISPTMYHDDDDDNKNLYDKITEKLIPSKIIGKRIKIWNENLVTYEEATVIEYVSNIDKYRCEYIDYDDYYNQFNDEDLNDFNCYWLWLDETIKESIIPKKKSISYINSNNNDDISNDNSSNSNNNNHNLSIDTSHHFQPIIGIIGTTGSVGTFSPLGSEEKSPLGHGFSHNQQQQQQQQQYTHTSIWYSARHTSEADKIQRFSIKLSYHIVITLLKKYDISDNKNNSYNNSSYSISNHFNANSGHPFYNNSKYGSDCSNSSNSNSSSNSSSSMMMTSAWISMKNLLEAKFSLKVSELYYFSHVSEVNLN